MCFEDRGSCYLHIASLVNGILPLGVLFYSHSLLHSLGTLDPRPTSSPHLMVICMSKGLDVGVDSETAPSKICLKTARSGSEEVFTSSNGLLMYSATSASPYTLSRGRSIRNCSLLEH